MEQRNSGAPDDFELVKQLHATAAQSVELGVHMETYLHQQQQFAAETRWRVILLAGAVAGFVGPMLSGQTNAHRGWLAAATMFMVATMAIGIAGDIFDRYVTVRRRREANEALLLVTKANLAAVGLGAGREEKPAFREANAKVNNAVATAKARDSRLWWQRVALDVAFYLPLLIGLACLGMAVMTAERTGDTLHM